jgi:hypothetical protein
VSMTPPSVADFLAQASTEEDEQGEEYGPIDPLQSIAASLRQFAAWIAEERAEHQAEKKANEYLENLEREYHEIESLHDAKQALLDEVLRICKPSTSKLANAIRAAVEPGVAPPAQPADEPVEPENEEPGGES